jgi:uncharacterized protein YcaQ
VIHHKTGTRKFYDLAQRHLPEDLLKTADPNPSDEEYYAWHVLRRVGSVGLLWDRSGDAWLGIAGGLKSAARAATFAALTERGDLVRLEIEDSNFPFYMRAKDEETLELALSEPESKREMAFLAPLDNLLWDRKLISALFGFDYTWEVYKRPRERQFGYYVLPVLYGERFVARFEPLYDKKAKELRILNWWWEEGVKPDRTMKRAVEKALCAFSGYLGAVSAPDIGKTAFPAR